MRLAVSLCLYLLAGAASAQDALPRFELGAAALALSTPDYRGSRSDSSYLIPVPYIKYRGERLRVDEGAQGIIFDSERWLITFSANVTLPVDDDVPEREGMDELEAILEIGPSINYRLIDHSRSAWWIDLPLRQALTLDDDIDDIGQVFQPRLSWRKPARRLGEWKLRFNFGPLYSSDAHHEYFYSVASEEATPDRPAYEAEGGYSGLRVEFTYSKRFGKTWLGGFVRFDDLSDSEIDDSPLVLEDTAWVAGVALGWVFHEF